MSVYYDMAKHQNFFSDGSIDPLAEQREAFPNLADAFQGLKGEDGKWIIGPATLLIFPEGENLKFCLSPKGVAWIVFGIVGDPYHVFESVDHALATGRCERKVRKGKN